MDWSYLFKHWIGTLIIAPLIFDLFCIFSEKSNSVVGLVEVYPITFIFSLILSAPTYILYGIIYYYLAKKEIAIKHSKTILIFFTSLSILITFHVIFNSRELYISFAYTITSIMLGVILKLKR